MSTKEYTGADEVLAKIATYKDDFRPVAQKLHEAIMNAGETLYPRLWYGMPGYAKTKTGPVLVYFRKDKYVTFGQTESAHLAFSDQTKSAEVAWFFSEINSAAITKISSIIRSATM